MRSIPRRRESTPQTIEKGATTDWIPASARIYAQLRCDRSIRAPDAIQLACAAAAGVDVFLTNDPHLQAKHVEGIQFIVSLERAPL